MRETQDWWDATAEYFQDEAAINVGVDWGPGVATEDLGILPPIEGVDVVELGCGGGQLGVGLALEGAGSVTGVDLSRAQLGYATELIADHGVAMGVIQGDVRSLPIRDSSADVAVSAYAFQWIPELEPVFVEAARILRADGAFVFSVPHPFYGVFDPETGAIDRSYHEPEERRHTEDGIAADQIIYRRRISDIHAALRPAGFVVEEMVEPGVADPSVFEDLWDSKAELMAKIPRTVVFRAVLQE